jgi:hypothetical protein
MLLGILTAESAENAKEKRNKSAKSFGKLTLRIKIFIMVLV